jgi:hypothetical protein
MKTKSPADRQGFLLNKRGPDDINLSARKGVCLPAFGAAYIYRRCNLNAVRFYLVIFISCVVFWTASFCNAASLTVTYSVEQIADAIYIAEGGSEAQFLYGIRSVKYSSPEEARRICKNTIVNNYKRFSKQTKYTDYLDFLASRYCPVGCDNDRGTNKFWVKNVRYYLNKGGQHDNGGRVSR